MRSYKANMIPGGVTPTINVSQYDNDYAVTVTLIEGAEIYTPPVGATIRVEGTKPDGHGFEYPCTYQGNVVTMPIYTQMTVVSGRFPIELVVYQSGLRVGSCNIIFVVERAPLGEDTDISETVIPDIIAGAQAQANAAAASATTASSAATNAVSARDAAIEAAQAAAQSAASLTVDTELSSTSTNPVQNKVIDATVTELKNETTELKSALNDVNNALGIVEPINKFNPNTISRGYSISTSGNIIPNASLYTSDFIPCSGGDMFWFARKSSSGVYLNQPAAHLAQYTSDKEFIKRDDWIHNITLESNCAFIRFDSSLSTIDDDGAVVSVTFNFEPTKKEDIQPWIAPYIYLTADKFDEHVADVDLFRNEVATLVYPGNVLNLNDILDNTIISSSGDKANDSCFTTNYFIPAVYGDVVSYAGINAGVFYHKGVKIVSIGMYDADYNLLGTSGFYVQDFTINQASCTYIRVSIGNNAKNYAKACVTINSNPTPASMTDYEEPYWSAVKPKPSVVRGRRVLWLGTSIPTYGYPQILANLCGARMFNEAIGSSCIAEGIEPNITTANVCGIRSIYGLYGLTQTVAEKQTMIDNWTTIASEIGSTDTLTDNIKAIALASSYETIVDPYLTGDNAVDLIVLNHAYNDSADHAIAPDGDKLNPHYLDGAYNWLIKRILEANPNIGIVIFGHYSDLPTSKETALQNVADRWNIPYYLLKNDLGWSNTQTITTTKRINRSGEWETITATDMTVQAMWLGDGVHPLGVASKRIAQVAQNVFADWLKMYCDN